MKELKSLANFVDNNTLEYNQAGKDRFKKIGLAAMRKLAKELKLQKFEAAFNPGGIAVAGDLRLMGMFNENTGIYITISKGVFRGGFECMYRTIKHMKDFSGGANNRMNKETFSDIESVKRNVYRLCGINPADLAEVKSENLVKAAVNIAQKAGKYDQADYDSIYGKFQSHLANGNYFKVNGNSHDRIHDLTLAALAYKKHVTTKKESEEFLNLQFTFTGGKGSIAKLLNAYRDSIWDVFNHASGRYDIEDLWMYEEGEEENEEN